MCGAWGPSSRRVKFPLLAMEILLAELKKRNYVRTSTPLSSPLVVHTVAGAGKSSLIRSLLAACPSAQAFTFGSPDPPNLLGRFIKGPEFFSPGPFNLLDEYLLGSFDPSSFAAIFADPLQSEQTPLEAHFTLSHSFRLGSSTAFILAPYLSILTSKPDSVLLASLFLKRPEGLLISPCHILRGYLVSQGLSPLTPTASVGLNPSVVTAVLPEWPPTRFSADLYISLSRHSQRLLILVPYYVPETPLGPC